MAHAGRAATAIRSTVENDDVIRFRGSILHRENVERLDRKPETGGAPTPPGVAFVRYGGSYGLGFRQTTPKTPIMAVRAVFRARQGVRQHDLDQSGRGPTHGRILKPAPVTTKLPAGGPSRITSAGPSATKGHRSAAATETGFGVGAPRRPPLPWRAGNAGVRGGAAPRQPPQGTHGVWPHGVSWLVSHNHADSRLICMTGLRGRPGLLSARVADHRCERGANGGAEASNARAVTSHSRSRSGEFTPPSADVGGHRVCWAITPARWTTSRPVGSKRRAGLLLRQLH